jgi:hypothetical protein
MVLHIEENRGYREVSEPAPLCGKQRLLSLGEGRRRGGTIFKLYLACSHQCTDLQIGRALQTLHTKLPEQHRIPFEFWSAMVTVLKNSPLISTGTTKEVVQSVVDMLIQAWGTWHPKRQ